MRNFTTGRILAVALLAILVPGLAMAADLWIDPRGPRAAARDVYQPIRIVVDVHVDPQTGTLADQEAQYAKWLDVLDWVMNQVEATDALVSFTTGGWFAERVAADATGAGNRLLQRIYARGAQIGTHLHEEHRLSDGRWEGLGAAATAADIEGAWRDNIDWVNRGIQSAMPSIAPATTNRILGAHVPKSEPAFHSLMNSLSIEIRQPGPEEDYYYWFNHYIWNPYRPSSSNYLNEDAHAPFIQIVQGSVIGKSQVHHGAHHDQTAPQMKRQFLQCYLNWRYQRQSGFTPHVWTYGWGSHAHDFEPWDPADAGSRDALVEMLGWLQKNFGTRTTPGGRAVLQWDTHLGVAGALNDWERTHPCVGAWVADTGCDPSAISSTSPAPEPDWDHYPYLKPIAVEMEGFGVTRDIALLRSGVSAFLMSDAAGNTAVVLWKEAAPAATVNLTRFISGKARVVNLHTGAEAKSSTSSVRVGVTPLLVTTRAASGS